MTKAQQAMQAGDAKAQPPMRLSACLLLAGGLRPSPLAEAAGRSILDLYVTERRSALDIWVDRLADALPLALDGFSLRVLHGGGAFAPRTPPREGDIPLSIEADTGEYRGPAGAVCDACEEYPPEATVLIGDASRVQCSRLDPLWREHARSGADVTLAVNADEAPSGVFIAAKRAIDLVPRKGFMDLKEQWLTRVREAGMTVRVARLEGRGGVLVRERWQFLEAVRLLGGLRERAPGVAPVLASASGPAGEPSVGLMGEEVSSAPLRLVCEGARVAPGAVLWDAVVMPGAEVGPGAVVVRSVVCPGVRVEPGAELIDVVAGASGVRSGEVRAGVRGEGGDR